MDNHAEPKCQADTVTSHLTTSGTLFLLHVFVWSSNIMPIMSNTTRVLAAAFLLPLLLMSTTTTKAMSSACFLTFTGTQNIWNYPIITLPAFAGAVKQLWCETMATSDPTDPYIVNYIYSSAYRSLELHLSLTFWVRNVRFHLGEGHKRNLKKRAVGDF